MNNPNILDVINTLSAAVGAGAIFFAGLTIKANKRLAQELRRIELAENLIVISSNVEDAFRHIRSQYNRIPRENVGNEEYHLQRRFDVIREYNPLFNELRDAQIRARTVLDNEGVDSVDAQVKILFEAHTKVTNAINNLGVYCNVTRSEMNEAEKK